MYVCYLYYTCIYCVCQFNIARQGKTDLQAKTGQFCSFSLVHVTIILIFYAVNDACFIFTGIFRYEKFCLPGLFVAKCYYEELALAPIISQRSGNYALNNTHTHEHTCPYHTQRSSYALTHTYTCAHTHSHGDSHFII